MNPHFLSAGYKRTLEELIKSKFCSVSGHKPCLTSCDVDTYFKSKTPEILVLKVKVEVFTINQECTWIFDNALMYKCKLEIKNPFQGINSISDQVLLYLTFNNVI